MYELKTMERYLRVNLLGPGPRVMKKEFTGPRSHKGWETLLYAMHLSLNPIRELLIRQLSAPSVMPKHCPLYPALEQNLPFMWHVRFHSHINQRKAWFTLWVRSLSIQGQGNTHCLYYNAPVLSFTVPCLECERCFGHPYSNTMTNMWTDFVCNATFPTAMGAKIPRCRGLLGDKIWFPCV